MKPGPDCVIARKLVGDQYSKVPAPRAPEPAAEGVWITFEESVEPYAVVPHRTELDALRQAIEHGLKAKFVTYGESL